MSDLGLLFSHYICELLCCIMCICLHSHRCVHCVECRHAVLWLGRQLLINVISCTCTWIWVYFLFSVCSRARRSFVWLRISQRVVNGVSFYSNSSWPWSSLSVFNFPIGLELEYFLPFASGPVWGCWTAGLYVFYLPNIVEFFAHSERFDSLEFISSHRCGS